LFEQALKLGGDYCPAPLANFTLTLYLNGRIRKALERGHESAQALSGMSDTFAATFGHPHLGLALAASGRYSEAVRAFDEARQLAVKHELGAFMARAVAMSAGFHLDLFDFKGNELIALEARETARSAGFPPSVVSANLDLVFNFARRGEVAKAESLARETALFAAEIGGWHGWLWDLRMRQAKAEIACARADWATALSLAREAAHNSEERRRPKYVVAGLETAAKALAALGRKTEAVADLRAAIELARPMGDPALFLRAATTLLSLEGDDLLLRDARETAERILAELPDTEMRRRFVEAEPVRRLGPLPSNPAA
jgi:tetratricopeptide (TPR) repeat protein